MTVSEQARDIPVVCDVDICVLGGSCTGVSAAVRAARLGARVAVVEQSGCFGGAAASGMVCVWHTLYDAMFQKQIIAGTTLEIIERLKRLNHGIMHRPAHSPPARMDTLGEYVLNTEELKIELDEMVLEAGVIPFLHTVYAAPHVEDGKLKAVIVENKSGRGAVTARFFIDATADGDLCAHLGVPMRKEERMQPAVTSVRIGGLDAQGNPVLGRPGGSLPWFCSVGTGDVFLDCSDAGQLTQAEMRGRQNARRYMDRLRESGYDAALLAMSSRIGVRETRQAECLYGLSLADVLEGRRFPDAIVNCCYPPDIHHDHGVTYYYLDGVREDCSGSGTYPVFSRWAEEGSGRSPFWQIPYRCLVPKGVDNVLVCGRAIDADKGAFAAVRVMVCLNQTGEAAGVAAVEALRSGTTAAGVDAGAVRQRLREGGSIVL